MGLLHSSSADSLPGLILKHLMDAGDVEKGVSPNFLIRKWPGFVEWSTKSVRDAFYASPLFPRLLNAEGVKETISRGVTEGLLAYVGKKGHGRYEPFVFNKSTAGVIAKIAVRNSSPEGKTCFMSILSGPECESSLAARRPRRSRPSPGSHNPSWRPSPSTEHFSP
jgi:hypothetical protein